MRGNGTPEAELIHYLETARDALVWKVRGVPEFAARRPMTPTGPNLLGLLKHCTWVEAGYVGAIFDRPFPEPLWVDEDPEPTGSDMFATAEESTADLLALLDRVRAHTDSVIADLDLDTVGTVPWWAPDANTCTLHEALVRMIGEWNRHAGHADILRELIDGTVGYTEANDNLPGSDEIDWPTHVARLQGIADTFR